THFLLLSIGLLTIRSHMDIFSLPNVFLQLMRTMYIKDRLRLRLICRAFEQLVAVTYAGYVHRGAISMRQFDKDGPIQFEFTIGDANFKPFDMTDENADELLHLRPRLFDGIRIGRLDFEFCLRLLSQINAKTLMI
ncbi:hypothetical protein PENTCL1PPCAC_20438, partial [Pristionchus entomophagus]